MIRGANVTPDCDRFGGNRLLQKALDMVTLHVVKINQQLIDILK
jgi:hypothetical protein